MGAPRDPAPHAGATYHLTGPEALTFYQIAERMTAWGRPLRFQDETPEEAWASRASYGEPDWQVEAWISSYLAVAAGELSLVTDDVTTLTGRQATSLDQLFGR
jgi:NAD(P)H dehydrogenase (quinone)